MTCIVYRRDSGNRVYAFESTSYWDKEKKQPRSKRTYLGRVDPETGNIIRGRQNGKNYKAKSTETVNSETDLKYQHLKEAIVSKDAEIERLEHDIRELKGEVSRMSGTLLKIARLASGSTLS